MTTVYVPDLISVLNFVRSDDVALFVQELPGGYDVSCITKQRQQIATRVMAGTDDEATLLSLQTYWNKPVGVEEFRFETHNFADVSDWDGRTNGDPAASIAGELGALVYNDVDYRWEDGQGNSLVYLDRTVTPCVWKKTADDSVLVQYNAEAGQWQRTDNNANVTSSRWSIVPYDNTKMIIAEVRSRVGKLAVVNGTLRYRVYMYLPADTLFPGQPAGTYEVKQFFYPSLSKLIAGANVPPGLVNDEWFIGYTYDITTYPEVRASLGMRLDITLDDNLPITGTTFAAATFVGKKVRDF